MFSKKMSLGSVYETNYLVHKSCVSLKMSDTQRKRKIVWYSLYVESKKKKKKIQMNLFTKQKQTHRLGEWTHGEEGKGQ